jgi:hypothetical protein
MFLFYLFSLSGGLVSENCQMNRSAQLLVWLHLLYCMKLRSLVALVNGVDAFGSDSLLIPTK